MGLVLNDRLLGKAYYRLFIVSIFLGKITFQNSLARNGCHLQESRPQATNRNCGLYIKGIQSYVEAAVAEEASLLDLTLDCQTKPIPVRRIIANKPIHNHVPNADQSILFT